MARYRPPARELRNKIDQQEARDPLAPKDMNTAS